MHCHVFNGDADGLCARQQIQLAEGTPSARLITGPKRDVRLLNGLEVADGELITVMDISLDSNRAELLALLDGGARLRWFDHHHAGEIPHSERLEAHIDLAGDTCSSLIVDRFLHGQHRDWAVVGAFGDNLHDVAQRSAEILQLGKPMLRRFEELGTLLNYNGYGSTLADLHFDPAELARLMAPCRHPQDFLDTPTVARLREGFADDMALARSLAPAEADERGAVLILPDAAWARRAQGVLGNELARAHPNRAHALLATEGDGYRVSLRAPLASRSGADSLCLQFPSGGGRAAAAGIACLPAALLPDFLARFHAHFSV
jgi:hypothetical protein